MADTSGQADIRGINYAKLAIAYQEEARVFRNLCKVVPTSNREIRWYRKTAGILDSTDTTGMTASRIANAAPGALPEVVEQSWTRYTSYIRKYFVASPYISIEDIKDNEVNIMQTNLRDLIIAVEYQIDYRIYNVMTEGQSVVNINTNASTAAWDTASYTNVNIIEDIMEGLQNIRVNSGFEPTKYGVKLLLSPKDHRSMMNWLIDGKGSSIPQFASQKLESGVVMEILGCGVIVSNNVVADSATLVLPGLAVEWHSFLPLQTAIVTEEGVGKQIRVWEEGEAILVRPKCVNLITNTQA